MRDLERMNKSELIALCQKQSDTIHQLRVDNEDLQDEIDRKEEYICELEQQCADAADTASIGDLDWFKYRLTIYGLMTPELDAFLEEHSANFC